MTIKTNLIGILAVLALHSCGRPGKSDAPVEIPLTGDQKPAEPAVPLAPVTNIGFEVLRTTQPLPIGCAKPTPSPALFRLPADFALGTDTSRWPAGAAMWSDPTKDAEPDLDIGTVFGGLTATDLFISVATRATSTARGGQVVFEFGGIRVKDGKLDARVVREFRIAGEFSEISSSVVLEERDGLTWKSVSSEFGQVMISDSAVEARISLRMVADILNWPAWWVRVSSARRSDAITVDSQTIGDTTSSRHYPSQLDGDEERFGFSGCEGWGNDRLPFLLTEITDRRVKDLHPKDLASSPPQNTPDNSPSYDDQPPVRWDFNSFGLVRRAIDSISSLIGYQSLGVDRLTIISSLKLGIGNSDGSVNSDDTARYGYIFADARRMAVSSTDVAAYEEIFSSVSMQLLRIHSSSSGFGARRWLQDAYAAALHNHLSDTALGKIHNLNHFRDAVSPYLIGLPLDAPLRVDSTTRAPKSIAFSYLLWAYFDSKTLVAAWQKAAENYTDSAEPDEVFRLALVDEANLNYPNRQNQTLTNRIWAGWVNELPYDLGMEPTAFLDQDLDGLPDFLETAVGYSIRKADSDLDGWTDLVSYVRGLSSGSNRPFSGIVADGFFDDWTRLLPQRLNLHRGQSGLCPEPANITHFSSLVSSEGLLIGAHSDRFPASGNVKWEAQIDFTEIKKQLLLTTDSSGTGLSVSDAVSKKVLKTYPHPRQQGTASIEWAIRFDDLGLDSNLVKIAQKNAISQRLRTVYKADGKESYCDETDWFESNLVQ